MPAPNQPPNARADQNAVLPGVMNNNAAAAAAAAHGQPIPPAVPVPAPPQLAAQAGAPASWEEINNLHPNNTIPWAGNPGSVGRVVGGQANGAIVSDAAATGVATHGAELDDDPTPRGAVAPEMKSDIDFRFMSPWDHK